MSLCTNVGQAMGEEGGILEVTLRDVLIGDEFVEQQPDMRPGVYLQMTVSDTGPGMPREVLVRIFDHFFSTKGTGEGTGLGLLVVHGIVKSCGGSIYAYSELGSGSSFKVYLPHHPGGRRGDRGADIGPAHGHGKHPPGGRRRGPDRRWPLILEALGYRVSTASNGLEALERFKAEHEAFDLVITDQSMPKMTGDELAGELLAIRAGLPIVIATGFSTKITKEKARAVGIAAFVMKPLLSKDLAETVRKVLDPE